MNSDHDRHLRHLTCLSWTAGPHLARRAQAQAIRELVAGVRQWAGWRGAVEWLKRSAPVTAVEAPVSPVKS
jgi:hypothetical protein